MSTLRLPTACVVVLVGPSGSGKSTWATAQFRPSQLVSTDALRALVGEGEHDQRAGTDAFAVLDDVLERRLKRGLLTVIDSLGLEERRRRDWLARAHRHGMACHAVIFPTTAEEGRPRNREPRPAVPRQGAERAAARLRGGARRARRRRLRRCPRARAGRPDIT